MSHRIRFGPTLAVTPLHSANDFSTRGYVDAGDRNGVAFCGGMLHLRLHVAIVLDPTGVAPAFAKRNPVGVLGILGIRTWNSGPLLVAKAPKGRQSIARGVSPGNRHNLPVVSPNGAAVLGRSAVLSPLAGLMRLLFDRVPRAYALGYSLSPLRGCFPPTIVMLTPQSAPSGGTLTGTKHRRYTAGRSAKV